jgi:outer membrane protein assembly factor BamA
LAFDLPSIILLIYIMLSGKLPFYRLILTALIAGYFLIGFSSCTIVKKYQPSKPFVYKTNINLIGDFTNEEKQALESGLYGQLDDSMQARKVDKLLWSVMKSPPVYDSTNADKSIIFMRALLVSLGYFHDSMYYSHQVKFEKPDQYKTIIDFYVRPGKVVRLDSISFNLRDPDLQRLADSTRDQSFLKKGAPFAKGTIAAELTRLTELYRNSGYLLFNSNDLVGLWDTLDVALLQPSLDPFEQLEVFQKLKERRENPTANLEIRLRNMDSIHFRRFYNGNVTIYPDNVLDTTGMKSRLDVVEGVTVIQHRNKFKPKIFPPNIFLPKDSLYRQRRYIRTMNRLNLIGAWRVVNIDQYPRANEDTVDFVARLTAARKYDFNANLEGSINQSAISGSLFGIGVNVGLQNRNFAKAANLAVTNFRYGVEVGFSDTSQFLQTQQFSFSHNIYFPRAIVPFRIPEGLRDNFRTIFSVNATNTERRLLYNLTTLNGSWGYEYQRRNKLLTIKFPNIEYSYLTEREGLKNLIDSNPSLQNIFTDGFVSSLIANFTITGGRKNGLNVLRSNLEYSPLFAGLIRNKFLDRQLYRFIKLDAEVARLIKFPKTSIALRFFAGAGYELNTTKNPDKRNFLPFFKQYFSGGPNSMRAWALRRLGPGSAITPFSTNPDRYGDIQLEANVEYRFPLGRPYGIEINGAVFTDMGNIWYMKKEAGLPEEVFSFSRLGKDIAIGTGAGLRVDFGFLVIRFDYSYKVKDPSPSPEFAAIQNKFFGYKFLDGDQFQLGIGYPFIF